MDSMAMRITWQDFGAFVQRLRRRQGISQERLGQMLRCGRIHIWRLEKNRRHPSRVLLTRIGQMEGLTPQEAEVLTAFGFLCEFHREAVDVNTSQTTRDQVKKR